MQTSINEFLKDPVNNSDSCFNFYDWFCNRTSLKNRMLKMIPKLQFLVKQNIIDGDKCYVQFKNNAPMSGGTYDDFRISTIADNEEYLGCFCASYPYENKAYAFSCRENKKTDKNVMREFKNWSTFKKEIKTNPQFKTKLQALFGITTKAITETIPELTVTYTEMINL